jgi:hypothetical protein
LRQWRGCLRDELLCTSRCVRSGRVSCDRLEAPVTVDQSVLLRCRCIWCRWRRSLQH